MRDNGVFSIQFMTVRIPLDDTNSNLLDSNDLQNNKILVNVEESHAQELLPKLLN